MKRYRVDMTMADGTKVEAKVTARSKSDAVGRLINNEQKHLKSKKMEEIKIIKRIHIVLTDNKEFEVYGKKEDAIKNRDEKRNAGIKCDVYIVEVYEDEIYVPTKRNNRWIIYNRPKHEVMFDGFGYEFCNKLSKVLNDISHHRIDIDEQK